MQSNSSRTAPSARLLSCEARVENLIVVKHGWFADHRVYCCPKCEKIVGVSMHLPWLSIHRRSRDSRYRAGVMDVSCPRLTAPRSRVTAVELGVLSIAKRSKGVFRMKKFLDSGGFSEPRAPLATKTSESIVECLPLKTTVNADRTARGVAGKSQCQIAD